ncbi:hypothetical protein [Streptomyces sp. NPDC004232]|uniref:hypothetical protein n=1 Tax=unclassified Streptomyces TaxID=2593676 RepID=UPI001DB80654|nr:hypothetical protein [Streptomyces sp. tea 10]
MTRLDLPYVVLRNVVNPSVRQDSLGEVVGKRPHSVSERVIGRQPFGVFLLLEGVPNAIGLAEIIAMPRHMELPALGATVAGDVIWHADHR